MTSCHSIWPHPAIITAPIYFLLWSSSVPPLALKVKQTKTVVAIVIPSFGRPSAVTRISNYSQRGDTTTDRRTNDEAFSDDHEDDRSSSVAWNCFCTPGSQSPSCPVRRSSSVVASIFIIDIVCKRCFKNRVYKTANEIIHRPTTTIEQWKNDGRTDFGGGGPLQIFAQITFIRDDLSQRSWSVDSR